MAKLQNFRVNSKAIQAGAWVFPGEEYGDLEVRVRGYTDTYRNAYQARLRQAARPVGGDTNKLSVEMQRNILRGAVDEHILLDVRNLEDDAGKPVQIDAFRKLLADPEYSDLFDAVLKAASIVGIIKAEDDKVDAGNSPPPSV